MWIYYWSKWELILFTTRNDLLLSPTASMMIPGTYTEMHNDYD